MFYLKMEILKLLYEKENSVQTLLSEIVKSLYHVDNGKNQEEYI